MTTLPGTLPTADPPDPPGQAKKDDVIVTCIIKEPLPQDRSLRRVTLEAVYDPSIAEDKRLGGETPVATIVLLADPEPAREFFAPGKLVTVAFRDIP